MEISISDILRVNPAEKIILSTTPSLNEFMRESVHFDGENDITFNIIEVNREKMVATLAVTKLGRSSVLDFDLFDNGSLYFMYGLYCEKIYIDDFQEVR